MDKTKIDAIKDKLDPKNLVEEINTAIDQPIDDEKEEDNIDPKTAKEYQFDFKWKDGQGRVWEGQFTNKILDIGDRQTVGILRARMSGGVTMESLDQLTQEINLMLAHMSVSLIKQPKWADDLRSLTDIRLLQELYSEVLSHEGTFFGYKSFEEVS